MSTVKNYWLDMDGKWFEVKKGKCYCNRDLTVREVKKKINKVHVKLFLLVLLISCNNNPVKKSKNINKNISKDTVVCQKHNKVKRTQCNITINNIKFYELKLKSIYLNNPSKLKNELYGKAKQFSSDFFKILKSSYNSEFNVEIEYKIEPNFCIASIHYLTQDEIKESGEVYNIESSIILTLVLVKGEFMITKIILAG
ncbi:MAG: hypothetical protein L3J23_06165 [Flavobacteriaceae bacterium]|nr:hypothetical protein [Flavobacteriaceae bacterium]